MLAVGSRGSLPLTSPQCGLQSRLVGHQGLRDGQSECLSLPSGATSFNPCPHVVLVEPIRRVQSPDGALPVVNPAKISRQGLAVDQDLALALNNEGPRGRGLPPAHPERSPRRVDLYWARPVALRLDIALEVLQCPGHGFRLQVGMDQVQAPEKPEAYKVLARLHGLSKRLPKVWQRLPQDTLRIGALESREIAVQLGQPVEDEVAVVEHGRTREVGARDGDRSGMGSQPEVLGHTSNVNLGGSSERGLVLGRTGLGGQASLPRDDGDRRAQP